MDKINNYIEAYFEIEAEQNGTAFFLGKGKIKNALNKVKEKIKGFVQNVGKFGVLIPFKSLLAAFLNKKGIKHDNTIEDIATKFYLHVIQKKPVENFEGKKVNNFLDPVMVTTIISAILGFIRAAKEKKEKGGQLTDTENFIVSGAEKISDTALGFARDEAKMKIGSFVFSPIGIISILVIVFLLFKKK